MKNSMYLVLVILVLNNLNAMDKPAGLKQFPEEKQKRIQDLLAKIKRDDQDLQQQSIRAEQRTLQFNKFVPKKKLDRAALKRIFPQLFTGIPDRYQQRIVDYAENLYGDALFKNLEDINKRGVDAIRQFKWEALSTIFGRAPYYGAGYVFIADPRNKKNFESHFTHLPDFLKSKWYYEEIKRDYENEKNEQVKNTLLKKVVAAKEDAQKILTVLVGNYKIHMMPSGSLTEILVKLLEELDKDPEFNQLVGNFKLKLSAGYEQDGTAFPLIAFYAAPGKNNAQKLLNKLYNIFKDTPGLNKQPRYNARVSDLLWVAQGDGDFKTGAFVKYYEPSRVYYRPDLTGKNQDYHLIHPQTNKIIN